MSLQSFFFESLREKKTRNDKMSKFVGRNDSSGDQRNEKSLTENEELEQRNWNLPSCDWVTDDLLECSPIRLDVLPLLFLFRHSRSLNDNEFSSS